MYKHDERVDVLVASTREKESWSKLCLASEISLLCEEFKDGDKTESIQNREAHIQHRST